MEFQNQQVTNAQIPEQSVSLTESIDFTNPLPFINYNKELDIEVKSSKPLSGKQYLLLIPITKFFRKYRNIYLLINILNGRSIISLRLIEYFVVNYVLENNTHYNLTKYKNKPEFIVDNLFTAGPPTIDITSETMSPVTTSDSTQQTQTLKDEIRMSILENKIKQNLVLSPAVTMNTESNVKTNNFDDYFLVHDNYKCQLKEYNKKNFDPFCRWTRIRMYYDKTKFFYTTVAQLNFFKWAIENYVLDYILDNLVTIEKAMNDYERAIKKEKKIRKLNMQQSTQTVCIESQAGTQNTQHSTPIISNAVLDIDIDTIPDTNTVIAAQLQNQQLSTGSISTNSNTGKKMTHNLFSTLDKKSKIKGRKKKEFTKTNRSILKYTCTKIVNFD
jgi:hypothetical protein